ncbi:MAG TPA: pyridoxamine 5'-phosphate oxidase family protein [Candidatus Limnocylindrales bacterium]|nr:pyridoxamine 5'-phosphate oxidase family protein [Candidatus Limnocylindrales bacterium]
MDEVSIPPRVRAFLEQPHVAAIATASSDGEPHQAATWYRLEPDGRILLNSRWPRRWPTELSRDGRCSLAVIDARDGYRWVGLNGVVESRVDDLERAREDICELAVRYGDDDPETLAMFRNQPRVSFRLRITRIHDHLGDE